MPETHEDIFSTKISEVVPDEAYKHAYEPEAQSDVSLWWVDDCFHNTGAGAADWGGYLRITDITKNKKLADDNPPQKRFNMLREIAYDKGVNLHCCSHEYAEAHWNDELNKSGNAILIDINYNPSPDGSDADTYGIRFYLRMSERGSPLWATCTFFSNQPKYVNKWIAGDADWRPSLPLCIEKTERTAAKRQIRQLVEHAKEHHFTGASFWTVAEWMELRNQAMDVCDGVDHKLSAHHLCHGGHGEKPIVKEGKLQEKLRERISATEVKGIRRLPDHTWGKTDGEVPAWDQPPIRAIAQFDDDGKDLTAVLSLVEEHAQRFNSFDLNVTFRPLRLKRDCLLVHDYLWFNACALAKGLFTLAMGFYGEVKKSDDFEEGRVSWRVEEIKGEETGLRVVISQSWLEESDEFDRPQFTRRTYDLPEHEEAERDVAKAYGCFQRAGGQISRRQDGSLVVKILSERHHHNPSVWTLPKKA